jgi:DNA-binding NarL/FixJ family response regulator
MTNVLIVSRNALFGRGVESLLGQEAGLDVVGVESDVPDTLRKIAELKPDIVVLDSTDPTCDPTPILAHLLRRKERAAIIGLNLSDNVACVCSVDHMLVKDVSDLLDIVRPAASAVRSSVHDGRV